MKTVGGIILITFALTLVQSVTITKEMKEHFLLMAHDCQNKTGASDEDLANLLKYNPTGTKEGKCLVACIMQKVRTLDDKGKLSKDSAMRVAMVITNNDPAEMKTAEEVIDACVGIKVSDDVCEAAEEYAVCLKKAGSDRGVEYVEMD